MTDYTECTVEYNIRTYANGDRFYYTDDKRNRVDGPAVEFSDGYREWWLNGKCLTEEEHKLLTSPAKEMTLVQVCKALGKNIKIVDTMPSQKWRGDIADMPDRIEY